MAWNDNPKVRRLSEYAKDNGLSVVVTIGVTNEGYLDLTSYGKTKSLCDKAKALSSSVEKAINEGIISPRTDSIEAAEKGITVKELEKGQGVLF